MPNNRDRTSLIQLHYPPFFLLSAHTEHRELHERRVQGSIRRRHFRGLGAEAVLGGGQHIRHRWNARGLQRRDHCQQIWQVSSVTSFCFLFQRDRHQLAPPRAAEPANGIFDQIRATCI